MFNSEQEIIQGDCLDLLKQMKDESVDAIITDPPYGLGNKEPSIDQIVKYLEGAELDLGGDFMGKLWNIPSIAVWKETYRVLKPGGFLLSFGGTRTWDLISLGIRAAGFEKCEDIARFSALAWVFGSGFPKSLNISKAIANLAAGGGSDDGATVLDHQYQGVGTALKPSFEPILVFQKPIAEVSSIEICEITRWDHWCRKKIVRENSVKFKAFINAGFRPIISTAEVVVKEKELQGIPSKFEILCYECQSWFRPMNWNGETLEAKCRNPECWERIEYDSCLVREATDQTEFEFDEELDETDKPYFVTKSKKGLHPDVDNLIVLEHADGETIISRTASKAWEIKGYAANIIKYGTGGLNIDACRVITNDNLNGGAYSGGERPTSMTGNTGEAGGKSSIFEAGGGRLSSVQYKQPVGRWPSNLILEHAEGCVPVGKKQVKADPCSGGEGVREGGFVATGSVDGNGKPCGPLYGDTDGLEVVTVWKCADGCPSKALSEQSGQLKSGNPGIMRLGKNTGSAYGAESRSSGTRMTGYGDTGTASRFFPQFQPDRPSLLDTDPFFYCPKTSRSEREAGCEHLPGKTGAQAVGREEGSPGTQSPRAGAGRAAKNVRNYHTTVKPISLMRWLIRLVSRPGQIVVDPYAGSGTTLCAAALENVNAIGFERESEYAHIAEARVKFYRDAAEK